MIGGSKNTGTGGAFFMRQLLDLTLVYWTVLYLTGMLGAPSGLSLGTLSLGCLLSQQDA